MSTRGLIAIENNDKSCRAIYVHFDMYPDGAGICLTQHYKTKERVEALLRLGDLSSLGGRLSKDDPEPDAADICSAYHRDYKEEYQPPRFWPSADKLLTEAWDRFGAEYIYVFRNGEWYMQPVFRPQEWKLVTGVLKEKENA